MKTVTYTEMDYNEFEQLVHSTFGVPNWEYVPDEELSNDTTQTYNDIKKTDCEKWHDFDWKDWVAFLEQRKTRYMAQRIIERLVHLGKIPEGNLLINVSW